MPKASWRGLGDKAVALSFVYIAFLRILLSGTSSLVGAPDEGFGTHTPRLSPTSSPAIAYVERRTAEVLSKRDIIRSPSVSSSAKSTDCLTPPSAQIALAPAASCDLTSSRKSNAPANQNHLEPSPAPRRWPSGQERVDHQQTTAPQLLDAPTGGEQRGRKTPHVEGSQFGDP